MTEKKTTEPDPTDDTARATKAAVALGVVFTVAALLAYDLRTAASVLLGAAIAVANLLTMRAIIRAMLQAPPPDEPETGSGAGAGAAKTDGRDAAEEAKTPAPDVPNAVHKSAGRRGGVAWGVFAVLKIVVLFGGSWLLLTRNLVDPMPLVVGYGVLPLGIAASSLLTSLRPRR